MPLEGKYLKYSPEITPEIFTLVWSKLESLFPTRIYDWTKDWSFESFKEHGYISIWGNNNIYTFGINNNQSFQNKSETTVQEILGYDPFVKDYFVLPEKWFIKITDENKSVLNKWKSKQIYSSDLYKTNFQVVEFNGNGTQYSGYTEITFDQFKRYVLKSAEESKEVIPEYVECIKQVHTNKHPYIGQIIKADEEGYLLGICSYKSQTYNECFKPSTKEAFDAQNQPKSVNNNGFFVALQNKLTSHPSAEITTGKIYKAYSRNEFNDDKNGWIFFTNNENNIKWFATKSEAEEFAKTLVGSVKHGNGIINAIELKEFPKEGHCKTNNVELRNYLFRRPSSRTTLESEWIEGRSIGVGWNEGSYWVISEKSSKPEYQLSQLQKFFTKDEIKQPLKQAVHCTTQEEWDFVTEKLGYKWAQHCSFSAFGKSTCISLIDKQYSYVDYLKNDYQILSFQEWCDLNGYKMEKKVKFEVGKWYKCKNYDYAIKYLSEKAYNFRHVIVYSDIIDDNKNYKSYSEGKTGVGYTDGIGWYELKDLSEIQQYLPDDHPDKITPIIQQTRDVQRGFRCNDKTYPFGESFRLATPEEINQYLISIGKIPTEKYPFKKLEEDDLTWEIKTEGIRWTEPIPMTKDNWKHKMILSINDEELPMVNIIKINTVKQLLNNN